MKPITDFENITPSGEYAILPPGGYECIITYVEDVTDKQYLKFEYDIASGEHKNYWSDFESKTGWTGGKFIRSYKPKALGMFKAFTIAVEESNSGYKFDYDEKKLLGKKVGLVLGEEEYEKNDGSIGKRFYISAVKSLEDIRKGKYKEPKFKQIERAPEPAFVDVSDSNLPF